MTESQVILILLCVGAIQVIMLFAQVKLFEINSTLKSILESVREVSAAVERSRQTD